MQANLSEQKRKDWERIKYRQEEYERRRQEFQERAEADEREQLQREERLQALADLVRPHHIETDPARVLQPTQVRRVLLVAWFTRTKHRVGVQCPSRPSGEYQRRYQYSTTAVSDSYIQRSKIERRHSHSSWAASTRCWTHSNGLCSASSGCTATSTETHRHARESNVVWIRF